MPASRRFPINCFRTSLRTPLRTSLRTLAALAVAAAALGACASQNRTACGNFDPHGGPPRIDSKDAELCESVRIRIADELGRLVSNVNEVDLGRWRDMTWSWEDAKTVDGLVRRARSDAGDAVADAIARAVEDVRAHSTRAVRAECKDAEHCLVRGAALGARIAFDDAAGVLATIRRARGGSVPDQERIENQE